MAYISDFFDENIIISKITIKNTSDGTRYKCFIQNQNQSQKFLLKAKLILIDL